MELDNQKVRDLIADLDIVDAKDLDQAFSEANEQNTPLADLLVDKDLLSDDNLGRIFADYYGYDFIDLDSVSIEPEMLSMIPYVMAKKQQVIVFDRLDNIIKIAMVNPANQEIIHLLAKKTGSKIVPYYTTSKNLATALQLYEEGISEEFSSIINQSVTDAKTAEQAEDVPIITIVNTIIEHAYENKASDIHIEPYEEKTMVRFRIDGILHDIVVIPKRLHDLISTRIKILSKLRTDEHRSAQDGKMKMKLEQEDLDMRVSIVPIVDGEKIVIRLLSEKSRQFGLEDLGFSSHDLVKIKKAFTKPHGMLLVTGPTGSGKTTSLYSVLKILNKRSVNISTIEDPVEYDLEGINQIQVNAKTNLTFASGLRSILRQDPDIIMVGEIRDEETAGIAINSAMTGHLVLSTLHTNDAPTALPRFAEMGIQPFLIASTVNVIIAQRLMRKICRSCIVSSQVDRDTLASQLSNEVIEKFFGKGRGDVRLYQGKGCPVCGNSGYSGRIGVFEVLIVSQTIRELIMNNSDADQIRKQAIAEGMTTMFEDGVGKAKSGVSTLEEVLRVTRDD